jgi:hypothetical protein
VSGRKVGVRTLVDDVGQLLQSVAAGGQSPRSPADEGLGESQFLRLQKKLSTLPTL